MEIRGFKFEVHAPQPIETTQTDNTSITSLGKATRTEGEKGQLRLRLQTKAGDISVAYKEIDLHKKPSFFESITNKIFYKKINVQDGTGQSRKVRVNISSMSKKLNVSRSIVSSSDSKSIAIFVKNQAFISQLTKQGLKDTKAINLAKHIEANFDSWVNGKQEQYIKKDNSKLARTIEFIPSGETGEVYVHLKSKGKGFIGAGGFGKVTKSIIYSTGTLLAQKTALQDTHKPQLQSEGKLHQDFKDCENVLQAIHVGDHGILLEHMNMGSLNSMNTLSSEQRKSVIKQLCSGMKQIHDKGYVHNDVKSDNFLLKRDGDKVIAKVSDLGLVRKEGTPDTGGGTSFAMSSDRIRNLFKNQKDNYDQKDDMFALGIALYEQEHRTLPPFCSLSSRLVSISEELFSLRKELALHERNALSVIVSEAKDPENIDFSRFEWATPEFKAKVKEYIQKNNDAQQMLEKLDGEIEAFRETEPKNGTVDHLIWNLINPNKTERPNAQAAENEANRLNMQAMQDRAKVNTLLNNLDEMGF